MTKTKKKAVKNPRPKLFVSGLQVQLARKKIKATPASMAHMLVADTEQYKKWEAKGLRGPHDIEGPTGRIIQLILRLDGKDLKDILKSLGFKK